MKPTLSNKLAPIAFRPLSQRSGASIAPSWWPKLPIRSQLLIAIGIVCFAATIFASVLAVFRANERARVETQATLLIAERLIIEAIRGLPKSTPPDRVKGYVSQQLRFVRHVRTSFTDSEGHTSLVLPPFATNVDFKERAPAWFERLVYGAADVRTVPVVLDNQNIGSFTITGEPADEIAEVWDDLSEVSLVAGSVISLMFAMLYWVLGRVLKPLRNLSAGLQELEAGHYATRVDIPQVRELEPIAEHFNALAEALGTARAENRELLGYFITLQEDERRQIATELHDEAGPCLFGITANAGSILTIARATGDDVKLKVTERVTAILDSAERLKSLNRGRLKTLRPIAIGRVSLEELLTELVAEFEKRYPDVTFFLAIEPIAPRYGEAIELTIYRCLQQGLTNALQHGAAKNLDARLWLRSAQHSGRELVLTMTDDGTGIPDRTPLGFGLSAMRERVLAVNGTCSIARAEPSGTVITITIPVQDGGAAHRGALSCEGPTP